ncbi:hypothetical protein NDA11_001856 [Ustilago hordei]|nr:hypothetical protein NDA12_005102 [Ustilago hordei]KAJ1578271.1 hypothetical protein NDA11_001856 [Ustilago hordei]KAJ1592449.1 hypothetical protein NDA15_002513 [Ustilago hordei]
MAPVSLRVYTLLWHCFSCSLWSRRSSAISSLLVVTPTSSKWQGTPSFILPLMVAPILLHQVHHRLGPLPHQGGKPHVIIICLIVRLVREASSNWFPQELLYNCGSTDPNELHCKVLILLIPTNSASSCTAGPMTNQHLLQLEGGGSKKHTNQPVVMYTVANWASDLTNRCRSASGVVTYMYGFPVSWKSHLQKCVALSAVEAEFVAASEAMREALFFSYLLMDLGIKDIKPLLCTDSQGCMQVSKDLAKHWKLKHINTRYCSVRDHVQGDVEIDFVGTASNVADILTKPLKGIVMTRS